MFMKEFNSNMIKTAIILTSKFNIIEDWSARVNPIITDPANHVILYE